MFKYLSSFIVFQILFKCIFYNTFYTMLCKANDIGAIKLTLIDDDKKKNIQ